jgi:hypothetical protein
MELPAGVSTSTYTYAGTGYANPHAVTQIANGVSTSTFVWDNNGNLIQKTVDGTSTTYQYDYANRLIALGVSGATTTYGYDAFGSRVLQTGTTTTYIYPSKYYSVASSTGTGAKYATTTSYVFNGDTLLSTVDQQLAGGVATGTAAVRYVHQITWGARMSSPMRTAPCADTRLLPVWSDAHISFDIYERKTKIHRPICR